MNVAELIKRQAQIHPYKKAIIFPDSRDEKGRNRYTHLSFSQLDEASDQLGQTFLELGLKAQMTALLFIRPSLEFSLVTFALFKIGVVPVLIDPGMGRSMLLNAIKQQKPDALIAVPLVHGLRWFFPNVFSSVKIAISTGKRGGIRAYSLKKLINKGKTNRRRAFKMVDASNDATAAIVFTSGGTGSPKGVVYSHGNFIEQIRILKELFSYQPDDIDMPGFPLFSLTSMAMGITSVLPRLDPSRPATANPRELIEVIEDHGVSTTAGSPAIWKRVLAYCQKEQIQLKSIRALIMFGAPVPPALIEGFAAILPNGTTHTPYGATECLPVTSITGEKILQLGASSKSKGGAGTLVGTKVQGTQVRVVHITAKGVVDAARMEVGEVIVQGAQATDRYFQNQAATDLAKIRQPDGTFWHRMGDFGYFDERDQLWFCGRVAHAVPTQAGLLYSVCCEAVFNSHPAIARTALIGLPGNRPSLVIERRDKKTHLPKEEARSFRLELQNLAAKHNHTQILDTFFLHPDFPVDRRHNIKIDRLMLAKYFSSHQKDFL